MVGGVIVVLLVVLAVIGLASGGDDGGSGADGGGKDGGAKQEAGNPKGDGKSGDSTGGGLEPIDLTVEPLDTVQVCLVGDSKSPLIDSQVIAAGAVEKFSGEKSYRLDLAGGGSVRIQAGSEEQKVEASDDASFEVNSKGISEAPYAGPDCP